MHTHTGMTEAFLCSSGEGRIEVDGRPFLLRAGTLVVCQPGESHEIVNSGSEELVLLVLGILDV